MAYGYDDIVMTTRSYHENPTMVMTTHTVTMTTSYGDYLAIIVEVGVEPHSAVSGGHEVYQHGAPGIVSGKKYIKVETSIGIGCL